MHDPMTVAFELRRPNIIIWHVDPEKDGTDDSCGYSTPKLNKWQRERIKNLAWHETREPHFMWENSKKLADPATGEVLCRSLVLLIARVLKIRLSLDAATRLACDLIHCPGDNLKSMFCFQPGYHENTTDDTPEARTYSAERLYFCVAKAILRHKRRWYQHPKWHVWHWKIQVSGLISFKRWLFSKCCVCGQGFKFGESPIGNWDSTGPLWFRSEKGITHTACHSKACVPPPTAP